MTEYVSGVDLVEHMLNIAAKKPLPAELTTESMIQNIKGWALEARVYAEDPFRGFLPSTGYVGRASAGVCARRRGIWR